MEVSHFSFSPRRGNTDDGKCQQSESADTISNPTCCAALFISLVSSLLLHLHPCHLLAAPDTTPSQQLHHRLRWHVGFL